MNLRLNVMLKFVLIYRREWNILAKSNSRARKRQNSGHHKWDTRKAWCCERNWEKPPGTSPSVPRHGSSGSVSGRTTGRYRKPGATSQLLRQRRHRAPADRQEVPEKYQEMDLLCYHNFACHHLVCCVVHCETLGK